MNQVKSDLICEIIRNSQSNLLEKKKLNYDISSEDYEKNVTEWVRDNARYYREHFANVLESFSCVKLGEILKVISDTQKDLEEILDSNELSTNENIEQKSVNPESDKKNV
ncbi:MAG: hypothetical protein ACQ9MH_01305 [Nitrospinales bacterium]